MDCKIQPNHLKMDYYLTKFEWAVKAVLNPSLHSCQPPFSHGRGCQNDHCSQITLFYSETTNFFDLGDHTESVWHGSDNYCISSFCDVLINILYSGESTILCTRFSLAPCLSLFLPAYSCCNTPDPLLTSTQSSL